MGRASRSDGPNSDGWSGSSKTAAKISGVSARARRDANAVRSTFTYASMS